MWKLIPIIFLLSCAPTIKVEDYITGYCDGWNARERYESHTQAAVDSIEACHKK